MEITIKFSILFLKMLAYTSPIWLSQIAVIAVLGVVVGKKEGWSKSDSLYYAFITATTVGYGDFRPQKNMSKLVAIIIALNGVLFTGLLVALSLESIRMAFSPS